MDGLQSIFLAIFVTLFLGLATSAWLFLDRRRNYWKTRNFPCSSNPVLFFGDYKDTNKTEHMSKTNQRLYQDFKARQLPVGGSILFVIQSAIVIDPELIKAILVKDFSTFHDRGVYNNPEVDPLSGHLFALEGQPWRQLRMKLSPTFTSGKMKMMFETILGVANELRSYLGEKVGSEGSAEVMMKDLLVGFTTDVIGSCAFGLECNSLRSEKCRVREIALQVFQQSKLQVLKMMFMMIFKGIATTFKMRSLPAAVEKFFIELVHDTVRQREKNNVQRNDFMNLLIQLKNSEDPDARITMDEMAAQSFVFFLAGSETSSTAMVNCMYELAMNQDIQDKLRNEITRVCGKGKLTYEAVNSVEYLNMVIDETLRKHPSVDFLMRTSNSDFPVPNSDLTIPKGTFLIVPTYALQHDPDHYPDPDRFDPERFNETNCASRHPFVYLPFGEGPRNCIGMRFGLMQIRVGLITMLREFRVLPGVNTPVPLELDVTSNMPMPKGGVPLLVERI
ncbi:cytochrome P450 [Culex quinquefasciatus]|uniref:Cytochrome P450 n=1 Tax=Culex quinquefasciatus TaxID=7176 RepID=B0WFC0_CULQU|nr:cytochrome P450 [Culex quinquefasciatus]|eukprot:XP_001847404.1 cytochrome P450 [Culex quinquefasciatus]